MRNCQQNCTLFFDFNCNTNIVILICLQNLSQLLHNNFPIACTSVQKHLTHEVIVQRNPHFVYINKKSYQLTPSATIQRNFIEQNNKCNWKTTTHGAINIGFRCEEENRSCHNYRMFSCDHLIDNLLRIEY
jgi:hypothetical protein